MRNNAHPLLDRDLRYAAWMEVRNRIEELVGDWRDIEPAYERLGPQEQIAFIMSMDALMNAAALKGPDKC